MFSLIHNKINPKQNKIKPLRQSPYSDTVLKDENESDYENNWYQSQLVSTKKPESMLAQN